MSGSRSKAAVLYKEALEILGVEFEDDSADTPMRVIKMYEELFSSNGKALVPVKEVHNPSTEIKMFQFDKYDYDQLIIVQDIPFSSMCAHHHVPFYGVGHIGYLPGEGLTGLSKLARVLEFYSKRPQTQEHLAEQVCKFIYETIEPRFVMVVLQAEHLCMAIRGVKKPGSKTTTSKLMFKKKLCDPMSLKAEFIELVRLGHDKD